MKTCPSCQAQNADANKFCQHCGKPFPAVEISSDKTVMWGNRPLPAPRVPRQVATIEDIFGGKDRLVIGRAPDCDVCLPHPLVSRYHALIERRPGSLRIRDLASINGTWVGGQRVTEPTTIVDGDRVGIGPYLFHLKDGKVSTTDATRGLRLEARGLEKAVPLLDGSRKKLLDDINLVVNPGEFVTLLGPSGSGKSTLMDCLNGRRRATAGQVLANGEDFYRHYNNFRQSLGYVPQKDIVHYQLTVYRALYYTAKLRLPTDTDPSELQARLAEVLRLMDLTERRDTLVSNLSGGQIKRVSLGAELIAEPSLLYIDEATSGLDAGTETRMMRLFRKLADEGRSIICITHALENVDQCHLILMLARGQMVYYGPPSEAVAFFKVPKIGQVYDRIGERDPEAWRKDFEATSLYQEFVAKRLEQAPPEEARPPVPETLPGVEFGAAHASSGTLPAVPAAEEKQEARVGRRSYLIGLSQWPPLADAVRGLGSRYVKTRKFLSPVLDTWHQFRVLTARTIDLVASDRRGLRLLLLQAPIVAIFLLLGFVHKPFGDRFSPFDVFMDKSGDLSPETQDFLKNWQGEFTLDPTQPPVKATGMELFELVKEIRKQEQADGVPGTEAWAWVTLRFKDQEVKLSREDFQKVRSQVERKNPRYTYMLGFILVMIVMWFGCNNAAKEIVKEEAIYSRERAVNLGIFPYLVSKFLVFSVITAFHSLTLMVMLYGTLETLRLMLGWSAPDPYFRLDYLSMFLVLFLLGNTGVALGLLLSACVATPDRANALLPYVLIPQLILGGGFLNVESGLLGVLAKALSPVYWGYRAVHIHGHTLPPNYPGHLPYEDSLWLPCAVLGAMTVGMLLATAWCLKRKEAT